MFRDKACKSYSRFLHSVSSDQYIRTTLDIKICAQNLSSRHKRQLVVLTKSRRYSFELETEFAEYRLKVLSGADALTGFSCLMKKLDAAMSSSALLDDNIMKVCNSRKMKYINTMKSRAEQSPEQLLEEQRKYQYDFRDISSRIADYLMKSDEESSSFPGLLKRAEKDPSAQEPSKSAWASSAACFASMSSKDSSQYSLGGSENGFMTTAVDRRSDVTLE